MLALSFFTQYPQQVDCVCWWNDSFVLWLYPFSIAFGDLCTVVVVLEYLVIGETLATHHGSTNLA